MPIIQSIYENSTVWLHTKLIPLSYKVIEKCDERKGVFYVQEKAQMNRIGLTDSLAIRWGYVLEKLRSENSKATFWAKNVFIRCFPLSSGPRIVKTANTETANDEGHL